MAYAILPPSLTAKDASGTIHQYLRGGGGPGGCRGGVIPWLSDEQRAHYLRLNLVEEIGPDHPLAAEAAALAGQAEIDARAVPQGPPPGSLVRDAEEPVGGDDTAPLPELVSECIAKLDQLGVESQAGNPTARDALRTAKLAYGNDVIAAAVRYRKFRAAGA
jgi:hypothetical protein